jgi:outer membrane protein assembly factor BamB
MNKKKNLVFLFFLILLVSCSFDTKTGIWSGEEVEKKKVVELKKEQDKEKNVRKIYSIGDEYSLEKTLTKKITLSKPEKNSTWQSSSLNQQNFLGNIYLSGIDDRFLKKKVGKNKFNLSKTTASPLIYKENIFLSDNKGTVFSINEFGKLKWKKNIYRKIYKKIYKNLTFSIYKNTVYVADNIGFIYAIALDSGKLIWIKNHGVPFKSKIKIFDNKIFLMNQDNKLFSFSTKDGSVVWNYNSLSSFIKSQNFLSLALSKQGDVIAITSLGDLLKINSTNGNIIWSLNTLGGMLPGVTDFFESSDIVATNENIIFSAKSTLFSCDINSGAVNWQRDVSSVAAPIIDKKNIFFVTENGYFVIINIDTGEIVSSTNILKILKKKKQSTKVTGFIMGSGKIYSVTSNGYLIVSSATSGKVENFINVRDPITSVPVIANGKLFIYTENSRILGFK